MNAPSDSLMLRVVLRPLVAFLLLFAGYVVVHGHTSPGGGFQGGVLIGSALILPMLVHGRSSSFPTVSERGAAGLASGGVLVFAGLGAVSLLLGRPMLDYGALPIEALDPALRRWLGILIVELAVAVAVAGVMVSLFQSLSGEEGRG